MQGEAGAANRGADSNRSAQAGGSSPGGSAIIQSRSEGVRTGTGIRSHDNVVVNRQRSVATYEEPSRTTIKRKHANVVVLNKKKKKRYVGYAGSGGSNSTVITHRSQPGYVVNRENRTSVNIGTRTQQNTTIRSGSSGASTRAGVSANMQSSSSSNQNATSAARQGNAAGGTQRGGTAANQSGSSANQQTAGSAAGR
jgi:hypothetical protein